MTTILSILLFGGAGLVLLWAVGGKREAFADGEAPPVNLREHEISQSALSRVMYPMLVSIGASINRLLPPGRLAKLRKRIILANKQLTWNVEKAMALKALGGIVGIVLALLLLSVKSTTMGFAGAVLLVGCGYFFVDFYLDRTGRFRQESMQQSLPDVLDQISVCVEAGLGFDAAMMRVSQTNDDILTDELGRTLQDIRLGSPRRQALQSLLDRTDVQDLRLFVRALNQAERSGTPIVRVLQIQAEEVREKRRQAAEERAMKLPVKLMVPLVLCILPALFTVIMGPAVLRMIKEGAV